ncbi:MAG: aconitate hydratase, partial [Acidimicrobiales bacterium]
SDLAPEDFNSLGARRGNHEVMMRGTFANPRIRNRLLQGAEGGVSAHLPDGEDGSIYDVAMRYAAEGVPLVVLAGKEYGSGSSRDWAAKGPALLGVRAVLAESFERIHRSNLVGMGIAPLQFLDGDVASHALTGHEVYSVEGLAGVEPRELIRRLVTVRADDKELRALLRIDTPTEAAYFVSGGILPFVARKLAAS